MMPRVLSTLVYVWLTLASFTAAAVILHTFTAAEIPNLDVLERVVMWVGAPALAVITNEIRLRGKGDE